jgi:hypothetical protein
MDKEITIRGTKEAIFIQTTGAPFCLSIVGYGEVDGSILPQQKTLQFDGMRHIMIETMSKCVAKIRGDVLAYVVDDTDGGQRDDQMSLIDFSKEEPVGRTLVVGSESAKRLCAYYDRRGFQKRVLVDLDFLGSTFLPTYCIGTVGGRVYACNGFPNLRRIAKKISEALQPGDPVFIHLNLGPQFRSHLDVLYALISTFQIDHVAVSSNLIRQNLMEEFQNRPVLVSPLPSFWPMDADSPHYVPDRNRKVDPTTILNLHHVIERRPPLPASCRPLIGYKNRGEDGSVVIQNEPSNKTVYGLSMDIANVTDLHVQPNAIVRCLCASSRTFQVLMYSGDVAIESVPVVLFDLQ